MSEEGKGWDHLGTGFGFLRAHLRRGLQGGSHCARAEYEEMVGMGLLHKEEERAELEPLLDLASFLKGCGGKKRNGAGWLEITVGN